MDSLFNILQFLAMVGLVIFLGFGPLFLFLKIAYDLLTANLRRQQRVRLFLDLLEGSFKSGRSAEEMILSLAARHDLTLGISLHILAAYLKKGLSLGEALRKVPRLMPRQLNEILLTGLRLGSLQKVFPVCRQITKDAVSQTRGSLNYLVIVASVGFPVNLLLLTVTYAKILPQFSYILEDMANHRILGLDFVVAVKGLFLGGEIFLVLAVWIIIFLYNGGTRLFSRWHNTLAPLSDRLVYALPWRRARLQRDFATMLAILLDAQVPEADALPLAANCTDNLIFRQRAEIALAHLRNGMPLIEAVHYLDDQRQFQWRLANALRSPLAILPGIAGWRETLDAKAFQQEQAFNQILSTALVILNGVIVGVVVIGLFSGLISIINAAVLW